MHVVVFVIVVLRFNLMISANHLADVFQAVIESLLRNKHLLITRFNTFYSAEIFDHH